MLIRPLNSAQLAPVSDGAFHLVQEELWCSTGLKHGATVEAKEWRAAAQCRFLQKEP